MAPTPHRKHWLMVVLYVLGGLLLAAFFLPDLVVLGQAAVHYAAAGRWGALALIVLLLTGCGWWLARSSRGS